MTDDDRALRAQNCELMARMATDPHVVARLTRLAHELRHQIQVDEFIRYCEADEPSP